MSDCHQSPQSSGDGPLNTSHLHSTPVEAKILSGHRKDLERFLRSIDELPPSEKLNDIRCGITMCLISLGRHERRLLHPEGNPDGYEADGPPEDWAGMDAALNLCFEVGQ